MAIRDTLKSYFKTGNIPLEEHFEMLIDKVIVPEDDGIQSLDGAPFSVELKASKEVNENTQRERAGREWLRFCKKDMVNPLWSWVRGGKKLKEKDKENSLILKDKKKRPRLTLTEESLNTGLNTNNPKSAFHIKSQTDGDGIFLESENGVDFWKVALTKSQEPTETVNPDGTLRTDLEDNSSRLVFSGKLKDTVADDHPPLCLSENGLAGFGTNEPKAQVDIQGHLSLKLGSWMISENDHGNLEFRYNEELVATVDQEEGWINSNATADEPVATPPIENNPTVTAEDAAG